MLLTFCIFNLICGCFYLEFFNFLDSLILDTGHEDGLSTLNMNPGDNPGGSGWNSNPLPGGGHPQAGPGGGPLPGGPGGSGGHYPGGSNSGSLSQPWGDQNISSHEYDPSGSVPPANNHDLYRLILYKFTRSDLSGGGTATVTKLFGADTMVNKIAKELLYAHILDNKAVLHTAFEQLDPLNHPGKWSKVSISLTSPIVRSLRNSL